MHSNSRFILTIGAFLFGSIISCSPALYQPLPEQASSTVSFEQLIKGRELYVNSCGSCHSLYLPERYTTKEWVHNLDEMQERSKITDGQKELILIYLKNAPAKTN